MSFNAVLQVILYLALLTAAALPLGVYMARVYSGRAVWAGHIFGPVERALYRVAGVNAHEDMSWKKYAGAVLVFNLLGVLVVYALQRLQGFLPLNPADLPVVSPEVAFNTAVSFASNTNWQVYSGESTMTQIAGTAAIHRRSNAACTIARIRCCVASSDSKKRMATRCRSGAIVWTRTTSAVAPNAASPSIWKMSFTRSACTSGRSPTSSAPEQDRFSIAKLLVACGVSTIAAPGIPVARALRLRPNGCASITRYHRDSMRSAVAEELLDVA